MSDTEAVVGDDEEDEQEETPESPDGGGNLIVLNPRRRHGVTPTQERAIGALLTESTLELAAKRANISSATLRRWRKEKPFSDALEIHRVAMMEGAVSVLRGSMADAAQTLVNLAKNAPDDRVKLSAAKSVLELGIRSAELFELHERLRRVEENAATEAAIVKQFRNVP
jgi:hypothetical protein